VTRQPVPQPQIPPNQVAYFALGYLALIVVALSFVGAQRWRMAVEIDVPNVVTGQVYAVPGRYRFNPANGYMTLRDAVIYWSLSGAWLAICLGLVGYPVVSLTSRVVKKFRQPK